MTGELNAFSTPQFSLPPSHPCYSNLLILTPRIPINQPRIPPHTKPRNLTRPTKRSWIRHEAVNLPEAEFLVHALPRNRRHDETTRSYPIRLFQTYVQQHPGEAAALVVGMYD